MFAIVNGLSEPNFWINGHKFNMIGCAYKSNEIWSICERQQTPPRKTKTSL